MNKIITVIAIVFAFTLGTIFSADIATAVKPLTEVIVANDATNPVPVTGSVSLENQATLPTVILAASTSSGELFIPRGTGDAILFYGDVLCRISWDSTFNFWIEFATTTTVEHMNTACPNVFGTGVPISLDGAVDHTFEKGERLVMSRYIGPQWDEVFRETL